MGWEGAIPTFPEWGPPPPADLQLGHNPPEPPETPLNYAVESEPFSWNVHKGKPYVLIRVEIMQPFGNVLMSQGCYGQTELA